MTLGAWQRLGTRDFSHAAWGNQITHRLLRKRRYLLGRSMAFVLSCAWAVVVAWLIHRAFGQRDKIPLLRPLPLTGNPPVPFVAVIIPARDEADNITSCVSNALDQTYPSGRFEIRVIDDHSEDTTFAIASGLGKDHPRLKVEKAPALPPHWVGKSHACWIGTKAAPPETDWFCFIDADVTMQPDLLASAVETASSAGLDVLSLAPRQELRSFAERLIIPCGLYILSFCRDLGKVQSPQSADATATGQFLLIRASVYDEVGGHEAVSDAICEDVALARRIKQAGHRVLLFDGKALLSTRMYDGWATLWPGLTKNIVEMLGGHAASLGLAAAAALLAWATWIVPLLAGIACAKGQHAACFGLPLAAAASAAVLGLHIAGSAYFRIPFWYGLLFPLGYTIGAVMTIDSVRRRMRGRVIWKGRVYS
jgi:chlorobactene glucosyltransferase